MSSHLPRDKPADSDDVRNKPAPIDCLADALDQIAASTCENDRGKINDDLSYDVGYVYYDYPSEESGEDLGYGEVYASLSFSGAKVGLNYSSDYFAGTDPYWYLYGQYTRDIIDNVTLSGTVGYNAFDSSEDMASFLASEDDPGDNYTDWKVSVSTTWQGLGWSLAYVDTNLSKSDCGGTDICEATAVLSISKSL